jgi:hypothetical protein
MGVAPEAEFILWGPEDVAASRIHSSDESVDPDEIEKVIIAQAPLLERLGAGPDPTDSPRRPAEPQCRFILAG